MEDPQIDINLSASAGCPFCRQPTVARMQLAADIEYLRVLSRLTVFVAF